MARRGLVAANWLITLTMRVFTRCGRVWTMPRAHPSIGSVQVSRGVVQPITWVWVRRSPLVAARIVATGRVSVGVSSTMVMPPPLNRAACTLTRLDGSVGVSRVVSGRISMVVHHSFLVGHVCPLPNLCSKGCAISVGGGPRLDGTVPAGALGVGSPAPPVGVSGCSRSGRAGFLLLP